jgi:hypothetical protein
MTEDLTIVVTTSPLRHNPDTSMMEATMQSLHLAEGCLDAAKIIVCDGYTIKRTNVGRKGRQSYRQGVITEAHVPMYQEYKNALQRLIDGADSSSPFQNTRLLELASHHGFGFGVRAALQHVQTSYVMVVQVRRYVCQ